MTKQYNDWKTGLGKTAARWLGVTMALLLLLALPPRTAQAQDGPTDDVLVRLQPGTDAAALASEYDVSVRRSVPGSDLYSLNAPEDGSAKDLIALLLGDGRVLYAEQDNAVQNPEVDGTQIHFAFDAGPHADAYINQYAYRQIHLGKAHSQTKGAGVIVAVLDTGATFQHPALQGHLLPGYNAFNPAKAPDEQFDGLTNIAVGHGTMVAGLIAYIAPDAKIMPVRVLDGDGIGTTFTVIAGIHYAVTHGAKVINMSFGATQRSDALNDALDEAERAGVVMVTSAGNDGADVLRYPAAMENVLTVASVEQNNVKSGYSNFGRHIGVVAPGSGLRSAYWTGGYANWSGTSFAAPLVAATAALVCAAHPTLTASSVIEQIRQTSRRLDALNPLFANLLGAGIIDVEKAVKGEDDGGD